MNATSVSLLRQLQGENDPASWKRLLQIYQPLIWGWLRQRSTPPQDAEDLTQEVLAVVVRELPRFEYNGRTGAFRAWLRAITANRLRSYWRSDRDKNMDVQNWADQLEDPDSELSQTWDQQHDRHVLTKLLEMMEQEFEPNTVAAFRKVTLDGMKPEQAAAELELTTVAVYIAKSRVLRRLRDVAAGLID